MSAESLFENAAWLFLLVVVLDLALVSRTKRKSCRSVFQTGSKPGTEAKSMKALKRQLTGSQKLVSEIQLARIRLARAESKLELARQQARGAKRRRKEAKQSARRAKKQAQHAKEECAEARQTLDEAEERFAKASGQEGKSRRPAKKKPVTRATNPRSAKSKKAARPIKALTISSTTPAAPHQPMRTSHVPRLMKKQSAARPAVAKGKQPTRVTRNFKTSPGALAPILEKENLIPEGYVIEQLGESTPAGATPSETQSP
jgi:hypothetical protein